MNFDRFLPDYGVLPSAYFKRSIITNPIELFWSDDLLAILRLCGAKEEMIGEHASDYDRFLSLCRALPLLEGHPTRTWIKTVLKKYFDLQEFPTEETAPTFWRQLCERLLENPIASRDIISASWLCDSLVVPNNLPENVIPVLNANLLFHTGAKNTIAWSAEIAETISRFVERKCQRIVFEFGKGFDFVEPSLYHVDRALSLSKRDCEATNLLLCQLMRELCAIAQKHDLLLVLVCEENSSALARLLEYAEKSVGLPRICWSVREAREAYELLKFTAQAHKNEILAALSYGSVITQNELSATLEAWKVRYPIGRLCFVTAQDLRQTSYTQAHIENMLASTKIKI